MAGESPLQDPFGHAIDSDYIHLPKGAAIDVYETTGRWMGDVLGFLGIHGLTKFMLLELIAGILCFVVLVPFAASVRRFGYAKGVFANMIETILVFIRDTVAIPAMGEHHAHKFLPFLWSVFFFILFNNLLGMIPWLGSPTAALGCTLALALCTFVITHGGGMAELGPGGYAKAFVPPVPTALYPLMLFIEFIGHLIRPSVLAVRLFVNMLAGHTVLSIILGFIAVIGPSLLYFVVTPASITGVVLLSLLELFVAFLQAYVFTFLSAIFIGAAVHPHH